MGAFSRVDSVGIEVHGPNSRAVTVKGIVITSQESNQFTEFDLDHYELVVTMCGDADERCPLFRSEPPPLAA